MVESENNYYYRNCTWKKTPDTVMIELTNTCNFSCMMCSNQHMNRKKGFMAYDIFKASLDRCADAGIKSIKLYTIGESLLHPKFMRFWQLAATYPFKTIMISTNGSRLTEEMLDELIKSDKFRIQFSFCGWDKKSYENRYVNGNFEETISKIRMILEKISMAGLPKEVFSINGAVSGVRGNIKKTKDFLKSEFNDFNIEDSQLKIHYANNWTNVVSTNRFKEQQKKNIAIQGRKYYCHIANTRMGILYDGRVTACGCLDVNAELAVGSILDSGIKEIRRGKEFQEFVRKLDFGDVSSLMCRKCDSLKWLR